jgi:ketosteroid isomerase-like protein
MKNKVALNTGALTGIGRATGTVDGGGETVVSEQTNSKQSRAVVDAYYQAGVRRRLTDFAQYLHPDFSTTAPNYLPWGGVHPGAAFFRDEVIPNLPNVLDFGRFSYDTLLAEDDRVFALANFGITGSDAMVKISEHWTVREDKATSIRVACFEPQTLLEKLGIAHITALVTVDFAAKAINFSSGRAPFTEELVRSYFKPIQHDSVVRCGPQSGVVRRMK